jgi:hypothetical protein
LFQALRPLLLPPPPELPLQQVPQPELRLVPLPPEVQQVQTPAQAQAVHQAQAHHRTPHLTAVHRPTSPNLKSPKII